MFVQCVGDAECPVLDTRTGEIVVGSLRVERVRLVVAGAADVRAALGFPKGRSGLTYMERALACARLPVSALEVLYPRRESERQCPACTVSAQGLTLARLGREIDARAARVLVATRASAREVEAAGVRANGGDARRQLAAAQAASVR